MEELVMRFVTMLAQMATIVMTIYISSVLTVSAQPVLMEFLFLM